MRISRSDAAWAAGFYEGEGWITAANGDAKYPVLGIGQKDLEPLGRFARVTGHMGTYQRHSEGMTQYRICGFERVQAVVAFMWPWLSRRRRGQIEAVLVAHVTRKRAARGLGVYRGAVKRFQRQVNGRRHGRIVSTPRVRDAG